MTFSNARAIVDSLDSAADNAGDLTSAIYARLFAEYPETEALFVLDRGGQVRGAMLAHVFETIFDFIGERSAETPVHPAVLLGSPAMRDLISSARGLYDCVVCDLPNILGHADVRAAADLFDALVLVAEWGRTPTAAATRAVLKSTAISDRLVGVIINKAPGAKRTNA